VHIGAAGLCEIARSCPALGRSWKFAASLSLGVSKRLGLRSLLDLIFVCFSKKKTTPSKFNPRYSGVSVKKKKYAHRARLAKRLRTPVPIPNAFGHWKRRLFPHSCVSDAACSTVLPR
jgi:hypothetical protein